MRRRNCEQSGDWLSNKFPRAVRTGISDDNHFTIDHLLQKTGGQGGISFFSAESFQNRGTRTGLSHDVLEASMMAAGPNTILLFHYIVVLVCK